MILLVNTLGAAKKFKDGRPLGELFLCDFSNDGFLRNSRQVPARGSRKRHGKRRAGCPLGGAARTWYYAALPHSLSKLDRLHHVFER
jgi:hypothetical protein